MRKQASTHADFAAVAASAVDVPASYVDALIDQTASEIDARLAALHATRVGWGWSGGKDSQALRVVMERVGIAPCVLGIAADLEIPAFLTWVEQHAPAGLRIIDNGWNLHTLAARPCLLFPQTARGSYVWFQNVQHYAQNRFSLDANLDVLILGRRAEDGNCIGGDGTTRKRIGGRDLIRYNPLRAWSHRDIFAVCHQRGCALPPFYGYPRGYVVGTGPWPKRRVPSHAAGWAEVYAIDPAIVASAANVLPEAAAWLQTHAP